ncbi:helix-turn-helix domain-containing protein [Rhodococcus artemisiae]|uniref:Helix-turn-helix domain-containing protein n=1 Tax=Rhodococcus artemisiae TaxID=714159 RepID=A0ABU7LI24_9NOCA|nr:helix-turn-helix domain-containing protein [Rhodococcus artemisiae]MEE2061204.1 helix-turn-helix domain-containing protein [Rhodococcus artemisiae]
MVTDAQLAYATQLRDGGDTIAEITDKTGLTRSTLYRHLPTRPAETLTAETITAEEKASPSRISVTPSSAAGPLACPTCGYQPTTPRDLVSHRADLATVWLHLDDRGEPHEARHCARCQPHGHVLVTNCSRCGDGPLVTGSPGEDLLEPILNWLEGHGWTTLPELVCGQHNR